MIEHVMRVGDKVWNGARQREGKQPNGYINKILRDFDEVQVVWHDATKTYSNLDMSDFEDCYVNEQLGYVINI